MVWWANSSCISLTVPRVEGSNPGLSTSFLSRKKNRKTTKGEPERRETRGRAGAARRRRRMGRRSWNGHEKRFGSFE